MSRIPVSSTYNFKILYPDICEEYDYSKNMGIDPIKVSPHSGIEVWWKCKTCGNEWRTSFNKRSMGKGCKKCKYEKLKTYTLKENEQSVLDKVPDIVEFWDYDKNPKRPEDYAQFSNTTVWFVCKKCGHEWQKQISGFSRGKRCPVCSNFVVKAGVNDLASQNPLAAKEWDFEKNVLKPTEIYYKSTDYAYFKCSKGHSWKAQIWTRIKSQCPFCSNRLPCEDNNLEVLFPRIALDWDYEKNEGLSPREVVAYSGIPRFWKCNVCGYEWQCSPNERTSKGHGCFICANRFATSFPEQAIYYYLQKAFEVKNRVLLSGYEVDIYFPKFNIAIEYNGSYYHNNKKISDRDIRKKAALKQKGVTLITVIEQRTGESYVDGYSIFYTPNRRYLNIDFAINKIVQIISSITQIEYADIDINLDRDSGTIKQILSENKIVSSFKSRYPEKVKYWDYEKNGTVSPENILPGSLIEVWWKCPACNSSWEQTVKGFVSTKTCKNCSTKFD